MITVPVFAAKAQFARPIYCGTGGRYKLIFSMITMPVFAAKAAPTNLLRMYDNGAGVRG